MNKFFGWASRRMFPLVLMLVVLPGCQKKDDPVAVPKTIPDQIREDPQFSLLRDAMTYAGVGDNLKGGNLTLLAPNDAAFRASGLTTGTILAMPKDEVKNLLMYHVLYAPVPSSAIPFGTNSITTSNKGVAFITKTNSGTIFVNGALMTQPDVTTGNGYLHIIDRVLTPSFKTALSAIQNNPNLTLLAAVIKRIGSTNPTLLNALTDASSTNQITVFAPSDDAFRAAGYGSVSVIESANPQLLANILAYHVGLGVLFTTQFQTGPLSLLSGGSGPKVTVQNGTVTVKGNRNTTAATIRQADIPVSNGVVHVIDQVLLP